MYLFLIDLIIKNSLVFIFHTRMFEEPFWVCFLQFFFYAFGETGTKIYFCLDYKSNQKLTRRAWVDIPGVINVQSSGSALKSIWI